MPNERLLLIDYILLYTNYDRKNLESLADNRLRTIAQNIKSELKFANNHKKNENENT